MFFPNRFCIRYVNMTLRTCNTARNNIFSRGFPCGHSISIFLVFCVCVKGITLCNCLCSFCVCLKRITLCNCLCSSPSSLSRFSASAIRNIGEFGAKSYFTDHQRANTIHCFTDSVPVLKIYNCY